MRLSQNFFNRPTIIVARELLGKYLCRRINGNIIKAKITETEAYCGIKDKACHASKGLTPRTRVMFGLPGHAYVYMIYGMYHCLNFVTEKEGNPSAVLIRGAEIMNHETRGVNHKGKVSFKVPGFKFHVSRLNGPGILCRELKIDRRLNGIDICKSKELWIESAGRRSGEKIKPSQIKKDKRIGVDYAGKWKNKLWRFWIPVF